MKPQCPLCLAECGETLTVAQLCRVLQISRSHYYNLVAHRAFPIRPVKGLGVTRYTKAAVEQHLNSPSVFPASARPVPSSPTRRLVAER